MNGGDLSFYQDILKRVESQLMDDGSPIVTGNIKYKKKNCIDVM